jgi:hypothetical protein
MVWAALHFGTQGGADPVVRLYGNHRVRYATGLVFRDSTIRWHRFDFSGRSTGLPSHAGKGERKYRYYGIL